MIFKNTSGAAANNVFQHDGLSSLQVPLEHICVETVSNTVG